MMLYVAISMLVMFLGNLIFLQTMRSEMDVTLGHLLQMSFIVLMAPISLPLLLILEFSQVDLDKVVFQKKS